MRQASSAYGSERDVVVGPIVGLEFQAGGAGLVLGEKPHRVASVIGKFGFVNIHSRPGVPGEERRTIMLIADGGGGWIWTVGKHRGWCALVSRTPGAWYAELWVAGLRIGCWSGR